MCPSISRFVRHCVNLANEPVVGRPVPAVRRGKGGFSDWVLLSILCQPEREDETFRSVVAKLKVIGFIREIPGLNRHDLSDPSIVYKAKDRLTMALIRRLL